MMDEGTRYPKFTSNDSRLKYLVDGSGAVNNWWHRSPYIYYSYYFYYTGTSGGNYSSYAHNRYGVSAGFASGEIPT